MVKNRENRKNREISRFLPTLWASQSKSLASIQVSLHTHIDVFSVNTNSKGYLNRAKAMATVAVENLRLENIDNSWKCLIFYIFKD